MEIKQRNINMLYYACFDDDHDRMIFVKFRNKKMEPLRKRLWKRLATVPLESNALDKGDRRKRMFNCKWARAIKRGNGADKKEKTTLKIQKLWDFTQFIHHFDKYRNKYSVLRTEDVKQTCMNVFVFWWSICFK